MSVQDRHGPSNGCISITMNCSYSVVVGLIEGGHVCSSVIVFPAIHVMPSANTSEEDAEPELSKLLLRSSDSLGRSDSGLRSYMRLPKISQKKHTSHAGRMKLERHTKTTVRLFLL